MLKIDWQKKISLQLITYSIYGEVQYNEAH